ncbi:MAG: GNAT family N-acetyltransferase [Chloroflexi bacterium]|nr:GNAT family N-acetyltransferase [Chloroflexota bacterium]
MIDCVEIDISIAPERRGEGFATAIIELGIKRMFAKDETIKRAIARIKPQNTPSRRAFERAGFLYVYGYEDHVIYELARQDVL